VFSIRLSDGTIVQAKNETVPSRRSNKNNSGRAGRRAYNGQQTLAAVGGRASDVAAIYHGADRDIQTGYVTTNFSTLCVTAPDSDLFPERYTMNVGGSTPQHQLGGKGAR